MVSCGYETTAVIDGFGSMKGFVAMVRGTFSKYPDTHALKLLNEAVPSAHAPLIQIEQTEHVPEETTV
jgi:hypothetical protein